MCAQTITLSSAGPSPAIPSDTEIEALLPGLWINDDKEATGHFRYQTRYRADGTYDSRGLANIGVAGWAEFFAMGTWAVQNGRLAIDCTASSIPGAAGTRAAYPILSATHSQVVTQSAAGISLVSNRWPYSDQQTALTLAYVAYVGMWGRAARDPQRLHQLMRQFFQTLAPLKNRWHIVWGPGVRRGLLNDINAAYIAQDLIQPWVYSVVIRGTNPLNIYNILFEVNDLFSVVPWTYGTPQADKKPAISAGANRGLNIITTLVPATGLPGAGSTIAQFLAQASQKNTLPVEVITTGHSLGGTLSTVLAQWLEDHHGTAPAGTATWDPKGTAVVRSIPFAGFTPGNEDFARRVDAALGSRVERLYGQYDVVPHTYSNEDLDNVASIYEPTIPPDMFFEAGIELTKQRLAEAGLSYVHVAAATPPLPGMVNPSYSRFTEQLLWQHVDSYIEALHLTGVIDVHDLLEAH